MTNQVPRTPAEIAAGVDAAAVSPANAAPGETLATAFAAHITEKMTQHVCESCGHDHWEVIAEDDRPENHRVLYDREGNPPRAWPIGLVICANCYHIRLYAIQPLINRLKAGRGNE